MKKVILSFVFICSLFLTSCTDESGALDALLKAGYHPITVGGYSCFACGEDDTFATKFTAYSSDSSMIVTGTVCSGWFKGKTIRLD